MKLIEKSDPENGKFYHIYMPDNRSKKTIYFIGPYLGRLSLFWIFIKHLTLKGYRVVYLQPCTDVLDARHPEWLGQSIAQLYKLIKADKKQFPDNSTDIVGVSLGGFLGWNAILNIKFKKFVAVAGGATLLGVFRTKFLFLLVRRRFEKTGQDYKLLDDHWLPYEEAFQTVDLSGLTVLLVNSKNDRLLETKNILNFVRLARRTGVTMINRQKGYLPHVLQTLSINFRAGQIDRFFKTK